MNDVVHVEESSEFLSASSNLHTAPDTVVRSTLTTPIQDDYAKRSTVKPPTDVT